MEDFEFIKGYENLYRINKNGDVWSCYYGKLLVPSIKEGYKCFNFTTGEGIRKKVYLHRLLGLQYIENPENKETIDHIDRNRLNNDLSNLRWFSKKEQANNKCNNIINKTPEELEISKERKKENARKSAEKIRRGKGIQPRGERKTSKEYSAIYRERKGIEPRKFVKDMTEEEKEERKRIKREYQKEWMRNKRKQLKENN